MGYIFLSFSHADKDFAALLKEQVEQAGFQSWLDIQRLIQEETWNETADNAVRQAIALIVVISPAANHSPCVIYEWAYACGLGLPVIPIVLETAAVHPRLETRPYFRFSPAVPFPWEKLFTQLRQAKTEKPVLTATYTPKLQDDLYNTNRDLRLAAVIALGESRRSEAVPELLGALADADREMRLAVIRTLGQIADILALPRLIFILRHDPDSILRTAALEALSHMEDERVIPVLIQSLEDKNERVHHAARLALVERGKPALERLMQNLRHPDWRVRRVTAQTLGEIGGQPVLTELLPAIHDPDNDVRIAVFRALGVIGDPAAVPLLIKALQEEQNRVWHLASMILMALREIGTPAALAAIENWRYEQKSRPQVMDDEPLP